jgi:type I restriction enzyme M protein
MVEMLEPGEDDYILDPACGTGGFLVTAFRHVRQKIEARLRATWIDPQQPTAPELQELRRVAREWAAEHLFGRVSIK